MGCGDDLSEEDIEDGYVDYIYFDQRELSNGLPENDGIKIIMILPGLHQPLAELGNIVENKVADYISDPDSYEVTELTDRIFELDKSSTGSYTGFYITEERIIEGS